ncbi:hypothetical protein AK830_g2046 [Neonectria ditissima]|uniref:Methyltransferase type 11 domain-containing protein n=1 Tax=Neonectria ditissima TaxID=78410 RepID=A0A0P7BSZ1_9HYPO|nr:hypothetical protein AK830_g2046 [Neonectria ditissima]
MAGESTEDTPTPRESSSPSPPVEPAAAAADFHDAQHWATLTVGDAPEGDDADSALGADDATSTESISSSILHYRTINGRTYHAERGSAEYWTPNDEHHNESMDINDFADEFPNAEIIGTDISPIQPTWVPPNVKFEVEDCTQEWTFDADSMDYVHMRYMYGSISDWSSLFKEAYRTCKPGGWVESYEASPRMESDDGTVTEDCAINEWGKFFIEGGKRLNRTFEILDHDLQKKGMEEAGFVDIETWDFKAPIGGWAKEPRLKEIGQFSQAALEQDYEGYVLFMANMVLGWSKEEVSLYCAHLRREIRSGKFHPFYRQRVVYGRKPE